MMGDRQGRNDLIDDTILYNVLHVLSAVTNHI